MERRRKREKGQTNGKIFVLIEGTKFKKEKCKSVWNCGEVKHTCMFSKMDKMDSALNNF